MKFYEVKTLLPQDVDVGELTSRGRGSGKKLPGGVKVISATRHARPSHGTAEYAGTLFVMIPDGLGEEVFYEFAGKMAREHGIHVTSFRKFGEKTLSLKGDANAVGEFIKNALDNSPNKQDEDTFSIDKFEDLADEDND